MSYKTGLIQNFLHGDALSVNPARTLGTTGLVSGGTRTEETEIIEVRSVGDFTPNQLREGMLKVSGNVNIELQSLGILNYAIRNSVKTVPGTYGRLPEMDILCGVTNEWRLHKNCKIDSLTLDLARNEIAKATVNWKGLSYEVGTANNVHAPTTTPVLMWYEGKLASTGSVLDSLELLSASVSINHNTDWLPVIDNARADGLPNRAAKYIVEKQQVVTANFKFLNPLATDLTADALTAITTVTITLTGTNTVTLTLTGLKPTPVDMPLTPTDLVEYGANFAVKSWTIA